ncbi:mercuric transporter MerT family protein [Varunaivibrio sulfuroxidans]|uniref:Mercuric transport protein MerT n=1 Tax=Varunaivibrio sulfuroxidans TaxID=1773489 RepID=A0A4V2UNQ5_9PROT|nr:mercuric transporter MerT family protein [Varunaivibrio sulfuroxidans]TCS62961.1 mercuric ion transport protein [Varunaivibrio sulfuroxidans]WES31961.1 mercuric transporter MerT family protein [Varunaivibrio sulfuroxidans]
MPDTVTDGHMAASTLPSTTPDVSGAQPSEEDSSRSKDRLLATGGILGALAASSCCVLPLVLFSLGISGAWIGNLTALYPYKPIFVTITALFLAGGFYSAYRKPKTACVAGSYCASPTSKRVLKIALWGSTALVILALVFPSLVPYLMK